MGNTTNFGKDFKIYNNELATTSIMISEASSNLQGFEQNEDRLSDADESIRILDLNSVFGNHKPVPNEDMDDVDN
ncbi:hypothetical protein FQA39_LY02388 [Lamprigera yunnana]|nr:hypothetical protein FQA39_LY02388 [Lamprigera yunnana]